MGLRERFESFETVLAVGAIVAVGAKRVGIPYNVALVVVGLVLVLVDVLPHAPMDPDTVLRCGPNRAARYARLRRLPLVTCSSGGG